MLSLGCPLQHSIAAVAQYPDQAAGRGGEPAQQPGCFCGPEQHHAGGRAAEGPVHRPSEPGAQLQGNGVHFIWQGKCGVSRLLLWVCEGITWTHAWCMCHTATYLMPTSVACCVLLIAGADACPDSQGDRALVPLLSQRPRAHRQDHCHAQTSLEMNSRSSAWGTELQRCWQEELSSGSATHT